MGYDLRNVETGKYFRANIWAWGHLLEAAIAFGWEPAGTLSPGNVEYEIRGLKPPKQLSGPTLIGTATIAATTTKSSQTPTPASLRWRCERQLQRRQSSTQMTITGCYRREQRMRRRVSPGTMPASSPTTVSLVASGSDEDETGPNVCRVGAGQHVGLPL
jgi:hypothetical protein